MPALLIETGFINSDEDNQLYDEKQEEIAQAIAGAILGTLDQQQGEEPLYYRCRPVFSANGKTRTACCICCRKKDIQRIFCRMGNSIKVQVGAFVQLDNAIRMEQQLRDDGYSTLIVTK